MDSPKNDYTRLLKAYLRGEITGVELRDRYHHRFRSESRPMSAELFQLLDGISAELEFYVEDPAFLAECRATEPRPGWYLGDGELREVMKARTKLLGKLKR